MTETKNDLGWISTDGKVYIGSCKIETKDEGHSFFCLTHNCRCEFDEGYFCPYQLVEGR